jgi:hypothetical protein
MNLLLSIFLIIFSLTSIAQKKDTTFTIRYHSNKKISTDVAQIKNKTQQRNHNT